MSLFYFGKATEEILTGIAEQLGKRHYKHPVVRVDAWGPFRCPICEDDCYLVHIAFKGRRRARHGIYDETTGKMGPLG